MTEDKCEVAWTCIGTWRFVSKEASECTFETKNYTMTALYFISSSTFFTFEVHDYFCFYNIFFKLIWYIKPPI